MSATPAPEASRTREYFVDFTVFAADGEAEDYAVKVVARDAAEAQADVEARMPRQHGVPADDVVVNYVEAR
jgi:hypothetical protein